MQTTFKLFISLLFCLVLPLVSGCGSGSKAPSLTAAEQAEVDKILSEHGRSAIVYYLQNLDRKNTDEKLILKYIKYFVSQGADVNAKGSGDATPLHFSATLGHVEVAKFLIFKGADVNVYAAYFYGTPLDVAKVNENTAVAKYLESVGGKSGRD